MKNLKTYLAGVAAAGLAGAANVAAQVTGTNAVSILSDNANNASSTWFPIAIGLIGVFLAIGLGKKFLGKAGARA